MPWSSTHVKMKSGVPPAQREPERTTAGVMNNDRKHLDFTVGVIFCYTASRCIKHTTGTDSAEILDVNDKHVTEHSWYLEDFEGVLRRNRKHLGWMRVRVPPPTHEPSESCRDARRNKCDCAHERVQWTQTELSYTRFRVHWVAPDDVLHLESELKQ